MCAADQLNCTNYVFERPSGCNFHLSTGGNRRWVHKCNWNEVSQLAISAFVIAIYNYILNCAWEFCVLTGLVLRHVFVRTLAEIDLRAVVHVR